MNPELIKKDFPILNQQINQKDLVYLDNGATSQKPSQVIKAITHFYETSNANVHRSIHTLATRATIGYEKAHETVANLINAKSHEVIFTRGTTDGLNKIARSLKNSTINNAPVFQDGDEIVLTEMEHHANIVPWQQVKKDLKKQNINITLKWIPLTDNYELDLSNLNQIITKKTKVLSLTHISNVLGTINPVKQIIKQAKNINPNIITIIDAAQSVPHMPVDVKDLGCEVLVFSSHKMLGPTGIGALYGKESLLKEIEPFNYGGDMIMDVSKESANWNELPFKFEAGTPSLAQAAGFKSAIDYLTTIGMQKIKEHSDELTSYMLEKLSAIKGLKIIGPNTAKNRAPVVSFTINSIHNHDINEILNSEGIAIRVGNHCAMPLMQSLSISNGTLRASAYIYNTKKDVDKLTTTLNKAIKIFSK
ncbi:SufS family cysteine desulfurase [archaeon]|jgi:cysteine desulfurase / selenocysteine lyase|nr:SufS family cysteine desulfurase [archaeon]MBT6698274.1 SufS family cysteine desulfurase [archaeon]